MGRRWALMAATPAALAGLAIGTSVTFGATQAGKPVPNSYLLCGLYVPGNESNFAGQSDTDHPNGSTKSGVAGVWPAAPFWQGQGAWDAILGFTPRLLVASFVAYLVGEFTNSIVLARMKVATRGRWLWSRTIGSTIVGEGLDSLVFITVAFAGTPNFDLSTADSTGDPCGDRIIYYASGHNYDSGACSGSSVGNFNTHGGAETGDHFRGNYGTIVYQWGDSTSQSPCKKDSANYCFEAILEGQTN